MLVTKYDYRDSKLVATASAVREAVRSIFEKLGDVHVEIHPQGAYSGGAGPIHVRASAGDKLIDTELEPLLKQQPFEKVFVVPMWVIIDVVPLTQQIQQRFRIP